MRRQEGYVVVDPPSPNEVVVQPPPGNAVVELPANYNLAQTSAETPFAYPRLGQSEQQAAKDRYECHRWAVSQTGFDPNAAGRTVNLVCLLSQSECHTLFLPPQLSRPFFGSSEHRPKDV